MRVKLPGLSLLLLLLLFAVPGFTKQYEGKGCLYYLANEPDNINSTTPLIILLHGYGSNEKDLFDLRSQLPAQAIVVAARAPQTLNNDSYAWYHLDFSSGSPVGNPAEMMGSIEKVNEFIAELRNRYHSKGKVYLLGFSQGSILSMGMALLHPESITGIVALSGRLPEDIRKKATKHTGNKTAVFMAHGTADKVIDIALGRAAKTYLLECGLKTDYHEYNMGHQINAAELADIRKWLGNQLK
jgi:phospholipase/carboxylesterase